MSSKYFFIYLYKDVSFCLNMITCAYANHSYA